MERGPDPPDGAGDAQPLDAVRHMAGVALDDKTVEAPTLDLLVTLAVGAMEAVDGASISLIRTGAFETVNATSAMVQDVDSVQYASGRGPCMAAAQEGERVDMDVADVASRWPEFAEAMAARGFAGGISMPLAAGERRLGSLNLYSSTREVFAAAEADRAAFFSEHAATVLANAVDLATAELVNEQLNEALATREVVGQAKGILLVQQGLSNEEAFDVLRRASQRSNKKLRVIASELVEATRAARNPVG